MLKITLECSVIKVQISGDMYAIQNAQMLELFGTLQDVLKQTCIMQNMSLFYIKPSIKMRKKNVHKVIQKKNNYCKN